MTTQHFDPLYVQVRRKEAASILAISVPEFDRLRKSDPRCPAGFKKPGTNIAAVKFRLCDIYAYSAELVAEAEPVSRASK